MDSPDGDQGYPGAVHAEVIYTLTDDNNLLITYEAVPEEDTLINLTNHSYFNLNIHGSGTVMGTGIGKSPMDFREKKMIGCDIKLPYEALQTGQGYDHNYCLNNQGYISI